MRTIRRVSVTKIPHLFEFENVNSHDKYYSMPKGVFQVPVPVNEPVRSYAPGTKDREDLQKAYQTLYNQASD
jgi:hypothetical protein